MGNILGHLNLSNEENTSVYAKWQSDPQAGGKRWFILKQSTAETVALSQ